MNWVKVMNTLPSHPKIMMAGDRAAWLYVCGLCYSNEHLTDGHIARALLPVVCPGSKSPERLAALLVSVGLWEQVDGGWQIHDYGDVQRTAAEVKEIRRKDRERKHADSGRKGGRGSSRTPNGFQPESIGTPDLARVTRSQEKKREEKTVPPAPPEGGRRRDRVQWEKNIDSWAAEHFPHLPAEKREHAVRQAVTRGADSLEAVQAHIEKWFPHLAALEAA